MGELVRGLVEQRVLKGYPGLLRVQADSVWASVDAAKVERAVDELLQHAVQAERRRGPVRVLVTERNGALITVEDPRLRPLRRTTESQGSIRASRRPPGRAFPVSTTPRRSPGCMVDGVGSRPNAAVA